jgi:predicted phage terminase large subunit-like protein
MSATSDIQTPMSPADKRGMLATLQALPDDKRKLMLEELGDTVAHAIKWDWEYWARDTQLLPQGDWSYWLIMAGRGFGKTRTGAETVRIWARHFKYVNIIGATSDDAKDIMIEGESGVLACCPKAERPQYKKHERKLAWPSGAVSLIFTADEPERLRGKQHEKIWGDELAAWRYPEAWDQAKFGLRLGKKPQAILTTTPRPTKLMRELVKDPHCHLTRGSTYDNRMNLAENFFSEIIRKYEGTRMGRQELEAELLYDTPGALWTQARIDDARLPIGDQPTMRRVVVAVDPATSNEEGSNETGIVGAGVGNDGMMDRGYVLDDRSGRYSPNEWARQAVAMFNRLNADRIIAEKNQGGDMVANTIRSVAPNVPITMVSASRGKVTRAEPIAALYEQGRVAHIGRFDDLEDQMVAFTSDFDRKAQGYSPDRVDALVWAFTDLFPRIVKTRRTGRVISRPKARFFI